MSGGLPPGRVCEALRGAVEKRRGAMAGGRASRRLAAICALAACARGLGAVHAEPAAEATVRAACTGPGAETAAVAAVEDRLVLRLADGRRLRLAGLDPAEATPDEPGRAEEARAALAHLAGDQPLAFTTLDAKPDRWGRRAALVFVAGAEPTAASLAEAALAAGLGRYLAEPVAHLCRERLLAAERRARAGRSGLWGDPYYAVLTPTDRAAFAERSATLVVAEGRLTQVVPGPYRTELRFAVLERHDGAQDGPRSGLTASIAPRVAKSFKDQGVDLPSLIGQAVRVRGLLDLRFGPRLELAGPDALESLAPAAADATR